MIKILYAVQVFVNEVWKTVYVSSFGPDADETYDEATDKVAAGIPVRLVEFSVKGTDFIATHADDFRRVAERPLTAP